jgi:spore germination cell wall hydrolase CwlJ-like protein
MRRKLGIVLAVSITSAPALAAPHSITEQDITVSASPIRGQTAQDIACLAYSIFREAGTLSQPAQYAVGQIHINRLKTGAWGQQLCQVVFAPAQFSWTLSPRRTPWTQQQMQHARAIAWNLIQGVRVKGLDSEHVLHYHADYVMPRWGRHQQVVATAGPHIFYRDVAY